VTDKQNVSQPALFPRYPGYCSFCRKSYKDVGPLAEGPDQVYICYPCIKLCGKIIEDAVRRSKKPVKQKKPWWRPW
jgi:hypothetical protein